MVVEFHLKNLEKYWYWQWKSIYRIVQWNQTTLLKKYFKLKWRKKMKWVHSERKGRKYYALHQLRKNSATRTSRRMLVSSLPSLHELHLRYHFRLWKKYLLSSSRQSRTLRRGHRLFSAHRLNSSMHQWILYTRQRQHQTHVICLSRSSMILWAILREIRRRQAQRRRIRISCRYYEKKKRSDYLMRWKQFHQRMKKKKSWYDLGKRYEEHRRESFALHLLGRLAGLQKR